MNLADTILYQFYPLTLPGVPRLNPEDNIPVNRIQQLEAWIPHLQKLGVTAVYLSPVFQSGSHGYDTIDYYTVDGRLGSNGDFAGVCDSFHKAGIAVILDGVFNHTGRDFHAFRDVRANGKNSRYAGWYYINWEEDSPYHDGFSYEGWEGCMDLVKLNLENEEVAEHIFGAVKMWSQRFRIDGLRLDVAYSLNRTFLEKLHRVCKGLPSLFSDTGFPLIGETIHSRDYDIVQEHLCDSCTNYELYKGLYSSLNDRNMFEFSHSLKRLFDDGGLFAGKYPLEFADNHDVSRLASVLSDSRCIQIGYTLLFTVPGFPCLYYGSEWGLPGLKSEGDCALRPPVESPAWNELTDYIRKLIDVRKNHPALRYGDCRVCCVTNGQLVFSRTNTCPFTGRTEKIFVAVNCTETPAVLEKKAGTPGGYGVFDGLEGSFTDVLKGGQHQWHGAVTLQPFSAEVWLKD